MKRLIASLLAASAVASAAAADMRSVTRDGRLVTFVECPKCAFRMRIAPDGDSASVNLCRLKDDRPSPEKLLARQQALADRAFRLMRVAADTRRAVRGRPTMGWSSWNTFGVDISEEVILSTARAMATNGLLAAGYRYVNIDDGFFDGHGPDGRLRFHPKRFPNGLRPLVDQLHALGFKAGIYSDAGADTCGSIWLGDANGRGSGLYGHDLDDAKLYFNELGFDFIKVDYCGAEALKLDERTRYTAIDAAIRATGRRDEVVFNACRWAFPGVWIASVADSWRTTNDIRANWPIIRGIVDENLYLNAYSSFGHYNDMDMLEVGQLVGKMHRRLTEADTGLTELEEQTHFGLWCMMSSPLLIGCDVRSIPDSTLELVTNPFLLATSQNDLGLQAEVVWRRGDAVVLAKDADCRFGTARYAALYNAGDSSQIVKVPYSAFDLGGDVELFDLVERADLGVGADELSLDVPAHGSRFLRLDAARRLPRTCYEAETARLTGYQELLAATQAVFAVTAPFPGASNGFAVTNLGQSAANDIVFRDVEFTSPGESVIDVDCRTDETRSFSLAVDGCADVAVRTVGPTGGAWASVRIAVRVPAGRHAVRLFNDAAPMPVVDRLRIVR